MNRVDKVARKYEAQAELIDANRARHKLVRAIRRELTKVTRKDLYERAKQHNVRGRTTMTYQDLLTATAEATVNKMVRQAATA